MATFATHPLHMELATLPEELVLLIFSFLPIRSVISCISLVSKGWNRLAKDNYFWKIQFTKIFQSDFIPTPYPSHPFLSFSSSPKSRNPSSVSTTTTTTTITNTYLHTSKNTCDDDKWRNRFKTQFTNEMKWRNSDSSLKDPNSWYEKEVFSGHGGWARCLDLEVKHSPSSSGGEDGSFTLFSGSNDTTVRYILIYNHIGLELERIYVRNPIASYYTHSIESSTLLRDHFIHSYYSFPYWLIDCYHLILERIWDTARGKMIGIIFAHTGTYIYNPTNHFHFHRITSKIICNS